MTIYTPRSCARGVGGAAEPDLTSGLNQLCFGLLRAFLQHQTNATAI